MQKHAESAANFLAWLKAMEWDKRGGRTKAGEALGKNPEMLRRYAEGLSPVPKDTRLAMTALAQGLKPWSEKDEGLPNIHFGISVGKE